MENFDTIIVHYDEIGLKGKNRYYFEDLLIYNIKTKLGNKLKSASKEWGFIILKIKDSKNIKEILSKIPGIAFFSFATETKLDIESMKKAIINLIKEKTFNTFKIDTRRSNKLFKKSSLEVNTLLGEAVQKKYKKKVKLKDPDLNIKVEIATKSSYISYENIEGISGLPTNKKQKVISLLSGGMDSPVAAYLMMKRGCEVILVHFNNKNQIQTSVKDKIIQLVTQLSKYQINTKLYIIPFEDIQKEIIKNVTSTVRMLIYRRFMIKIASKIAKKENASFLVVGDSLSQVASQTLENLEATYQDSETHILSPLIGSNKEEIMNTAKKIGTYDISSLPYGDCCSFFIAKHPELKANSNLLKKEESKFNIKKLIETTIKKANIINV